MKALIRLRECAGLSGPFAVRICPETRFRMARSIYNFYLLNSLGKFSRRKFYCLEPNIDTSSKLSPLKVRSAISRKLTGDILHEMSNPILWKKKKKKKREQMFQNVVCWNIYPVCLHQSILSCNCTCLICFFFFGGGVCCCCCCFFLCQFVNVLKM